VDPDQSPLHLHTDPQAGSAPPMAGSGRQRAPAVQLPPRTASQTLEDDADGLIRALFACGFTSAVVQSRVDVGADLSDQLTTLIDTLDEAIRGIRHALSPHEAA
jgi:hypothetical protein